MKNKHTEDDLKMLQALPLDIKIRKTQIRIQEWCEKFDGQVYVSESGITHDTERFVRLKEREPKKYDYVMRGGKFDENGMWVPHNGLGYKFIIDWLNEYGNLNIKY